MGRTYLVTLTSEGRAAAQREAARRSGVSPTALRIPMRCARPKRAGTRRSKRFPSRANTPKLRSASCIRPHVNRDRFRIRMQEFLRLSARIDGLPIRNRRYGYAPELPGPWEFLPASGGGRWLQQNIEVVRVNRQQQRVFAVDAAVAHEGHQRVFEAERALLQPPRTARQGYWPPRYCHSVPRSKTPLRRRR